MQFLDINGVAQIKEYVDNTFADKQTVEDNAYVTSAALNDLNDRLSVIEESDDVEYATKESVDNNALVTSAALNDLNDRLIVVESINPDDFVTTEEYSVSENVDRDNYTKQESDAKFATLDDIEKILTVLANALNATYSITQNANGRSYTFTINS